MGYGRLARAGGAVPGAVVAGDPAANETSRGYHPGCGGPTGATNPRREGRSGRRGAAPGRTGLAGGRRGPTRAGRSGTAPGGLARAPANPRGNPGNRESRWLAALDAGDTPGGAGVSLLRGYGLVHGAACSRLPPARAGAGRRRGSARGSASPLWGNGTVLVAGAAAFPASGPRPAELWGAAAHGPVACLAVSRRCWAAAALGACPRTRPHQAARRGRLSVVRRGPGGLLLRPVAVVVTA